MYVRLLSWSLRHRRWRHCMNAVTMAITVSVVMLFVSVLIDLLAFVNSSADRDLRRILVHPKMATPGSLDGLPMTLYPILQKIPGVKVVQRSRAIGGKHPSGATYVIVGEEDTGIELNTDFFPVEPAVFAAWKNERPLGAIVTEATGREFGLKVGQLAEIPTGYGPLKVKIVGVSYGALVGHRIAVHFEYLQEFAGNTGLCAYRVFTLPGDFGQVSRAINEATRNSAMPAEAVSDVNFAATWAKRASTVPAVLGFLGIFLVFTTVLTLANNSGISIRERRTEIATLRVVGFHRSTIVGLMLGEAVLVGLIGGLLAIVVTSVLFKGGVQLTPGSSKLLQAVEIGRLGMLCGVITSILVPLAGALPAALAAVRMPLVDALRDSA